MKIRRKQRRSRVRPIRMALIVICSAFLILGFGTMAAVAVSIDDWTSDLPDVSNKEVFTLSKKSVVYAADEETILAEFQIENRVPVESLDNISTYVVKGTVATEDNRFYEHNGVDMTGIARAFVNNILGGELEGASTITQQLVRNTILADEAQSISIKRKVREIVLALETEQHYSKDEILLMYLNTINYGDGSYGIEAAAQHYFSKKASELDAIESATLIGIPQSPTALNPVNYPQACTDRRNLVLSRMEEAGLISFEEYEVAKGIELKLDVTPNDDNNGIEKYPYFTSYIRDLLLEEYESDDLYENGWSIYTTLDVKTQDAAEAAVAYQASIMDSSYDAAIAAIDPNTGAVLAVVGGKDFEEDQFNIAVQKGRPQGSAFKMFTLVTAIEQGIDPATLVTCTSPITLPGNVRIENFDNYNYGTRSIQSATAVSSNTGFIRLELEVGIDNVIKTARKLGIKEADLPEVTTLTLGVADVTPLEMASAYATLAAGGVWHEHYAISKIVDKNGETVYEHEDKSERVLSEEVAAAATKVLQTVFTSGTATSAQLSGGRPVAGKTGTSEDFRDHTLCGYTPSLACATWIGDRNNKETSHSLTANTLFKTFMNKALEGTPNESFPSKNNPSYNHTFKTKLVVEDPKPSDVVGKKLADARSALSEFTVNVVEEYSDTVAAGVVISQSVSGTTVTLHVSKGPDPSGQQQQQQDPPDGNQQQKQQ